MSSLTCSSRSQKLLLSLFEGDWVLFDIVLHLLVVGRVVSEECKAGSVFNDG